MHILPGLEYSSSQRVILPGIFTLLCPAIDFVYKNSGQYFLYSTLQHYAYGSEFWTMYNWVQTWGKIKISKVLRATYLA